MKKFRPILFYPDWTRKRWWHSNGDENTWTIGFTSVNAVEEFLTTKRWPSNMNDVASVRIRWDDPINYGPSNGFIIDKPEYELTTSFARTYHIEGHLAGDILRQTTQVYHECVAWLASDPIIRNGKRLTDFRKDYLIQQARKKWEVESANAEARAADPSFNKKQAKLWLDKFKEEVKASGKDRGSRTLVYRNGVNSDGRTRTLYANKVTTYSANTCKRVDFSWTSYGGQRVAQSNVLIELQQTISKAKTLEANKHYG